MNLLDKLNIDINKLDFIEKIIAANIFVFFLSIFLYIFNFHQDFIRLFSLDNEFLTKPWSIFTYSFIHGFSTNQFGQSFMPGFSSFFDLIVTIVLLSFTSNNIKNLLGEKIITQLFIYGVIFGGIVFIFLNHNNDQLMGASAGISSLLMFLFLLSPNMGLKIFTFSIEFKYLMAFIFFYDFLRIITPGDFGVYSHIGGYFVGLYFYFSIYGFPNNRRTRSFKKSKKYTNKLSKVDKILDKISKSGYDSLNDEEKEFLFKQGGKNEKP